MSVKGIPASPGSCVSTAWAPTAVHLAPRACWEMDLHVPVSLLLMPSNLLCAQHYSYNYTHGLILTTRRIQGWQDIRQLCFYRPLSQLEVLRWTRKHFYRLFLTSVMLCITCAPGKHLISQIT